MRVDVESSDGRPIRVRVMTDEGDWTSFWRATDCQAQSLDAARFARDLAEERMDELMTALHTYAICDEVSVEESLASVGLKDDLITRIRQRFASAKPQESACICVVHPSYRQLDRGCPQHGDAAEAARRHPQASRAPEATDG